jgi:hypothetical protein
MFLVYWADITTQAIWGRLKVRVKEGKSKFRPALEAWLQVRNQGEM